MIGYEDFEGLNGPCDEPCALVCGMCGSVLRNVTDGIGDCPTCKEPVSACPEPEYELSLESFMGSEPWDEEREMDLRGWIAKGVAQGVAR